MNDMTPEQPTMADLLTAINGLAGDVGHLRSDVGQLRTETAVRFDQITDRFDQAAHRLDQTDAKIDQARTDIAAVKVDTSYTESHIGDLHEAMRRHLRDPNAHGGRDAA